ncbi:Uu.00g098000.m01.CDS01 [Anthostomella pinea]|uniref:Uu.00g098000.m01.CDS01 n=1 Tax=Anthostomella pinea TaxID=933095 RepID=A0AAI8VDI9_9PEZI|nr:Uu.00g098000.m01.CDS01 [Anthostomella pinea]
MAIGYWYISIYLSIYLYAIWIDHYIILYIYEVISYIFILLAPVACMWLLYILIDYMILEVGPEKGLVSLPFLWQLFLVWFGLLMFGISALKIMDRGIWLLNRMARIMPFDRRQGRHSYLVRTFGPPEIVEAGS